ncbi:undecaprenyl-phosphate galactose phosphotransferase WbaP [Vibrio albus]|nr:undecaprenyl-phosphate galactose phosphotransferase WbaP [Vibrio albus]
MTQTKELQVDTKKPRSHFSSKINSTVLVLMDALALVCAWLLNSMFGNTGFMATLDGSSTIQVIMHFLMTGIVILWLWGSKRHYTYRKPFWDELQDTWYVVSITALINVAVLAVLEQGYSVEVWLVSWGSALVLLPLYRFFAKKILNAFGCWAMPSIIIGNAANASEAYQAILSEPSTGFEVTAFVDPSGVIQSGSISGIPYIGKAEYFSRRKEFSKVFIALEKHQSELREVWLRELTRNGIRDISIVPALRGIPLYGTDISHFFSHEIMMLRVKNNLSRNSSRFIKRGFDIFASSVLLILLSPFFAFIARKVKSDGGSATYGHERIGLNGKKFKCLKFRSMVTNSKEVLEDLLATDPAAKEEWEREFKLKDDPRVTPIGSFLRKTSLDELPQLWNVLKGEMSLVGPRPVIDEELERYADDVDYYLMAKPGMSGLWQVSGRSDTDYATRVYLDSWYVKNWSLWYDIVILFKTVSVVLKKDGAY